MVSPDGALPDTDFERFPVEMIERDGRAERKVRVAEGRDMMRSLRLRSK